MNKVNLLSRSIKNKIQDKRLILLGEIHGTKEIPNLIEKFLVEIAKEEDFDLCLEIPEGYQKEINEFIEKGNKNKLRKISFFLEPNNQDGRGSLEYFNLIERIYEINKEYNKNIKIFCIDSDANSQEEKEQEIANNIIKNLNNNKVFAILGDVHASKNLISFYEKNILPAGAILFKKLGNEMFSVRFLPASGKFFNFGLKKISRDYSNDSLNKNFDYIFKIGEVIPCSFLKSSKQKINLLSKLTIRKIKSNEFNSAMKILDNELGKDRVRGKEFLYKKFKEFPEFFIGAFLDDELIGIVCGFPRENYLLMSEIAVDEKFFGRGFGKKLVEFFENKAKGKYNKINVGAKDEVIDFYKKLNYNPFLLIQFKEGDYSKKDFNDFHIIKEYNFDKENLVIETEINGCNINLLDKLRKKYPKAYFQYIFTKKFV